MQCRAVLRVTRTEPFGLQVAEAEQRHVARLDERRTDRIAPGFRAEAQRDGERHVRGLTAFGESSAVVEVQMSR